MQKQERVLNNFIGIDPGKYGAIACIDIEGKISYLLDIPLTEDSSNIDERALIEIFKKFNPETDYAALENSKAMRFKSEEGEEQLASPAAMLTFGENRGILRGMLMFLGIRYRLVEPQKWQAPFGVKGKKSGANTIEKAQALFPDACLHIVSSRGNLIPKDGRSDALLMAEWLRRQYIRNDLKKAA